MRSSHHWTLGLGVSAVALAAIALGVWNYLLFHSLAEMFSAVVAGAVFLLAWNAREILGDHRFLVNLGITLAFVAVVDLLHALAYHGMGVFTPYVAEGNTTNLATELWIVGRLLLSVGLLAALLRRRVWPPLFGLVAAFVASGLVAAVFLGVFPDSFVPGEGLTPFKIGAEVAICLLLGASFAVLVLRRRAHDSRLVRGVGLAIGLTIASELCFMLYADPFALTNMAGHLLKIAAYYGFYRALVELGIREPFAVMFRDLKQGEQLLADANRHLELRVDQRTAELQDRTRQLQRLTRELMVVERRERRRLATTLHDDLAQLLATLRMRLSMAPPGENRESSLELLDEAIRVTRTLITDLAPPRLLDGGLAPALRALADRLERHHDLRVTVDAPEDLPELDTDARETVYNAVRELLTNAAKYAGTPQAMARLRRQDGQLLIEVEDDGAGFEPATLDHQQSLEGGFGLVNVREQLNLIGGELHLDTSPGHGTRARVSVPL